MHSLPQVGSLQFSLFLFCLVGSAQAQTTAKSRTDEDPRGAIELYFMAHALGKGEFITEAFTSNAKIQFVDGGELKQWTREEFAKRFQQPAADEYRRVRRVERLDISGTAASAVLTLDYPQVLFTDHVSLLKIGDQWKIVSRPFLRTEGESARQVLATCVPNPELSKHLLVGSNLTVVFDVAPAGHILIDTGHGEMVPQVELKHQLGSNQDVKNLP